MLIVCPSCASQYEIAADRLGAKGRSVRCAACRETWFIAPDEGSDTGSMTGAGAEPSSLAAGIKSAEPIAETDASSPGAKSDDPGIAEPAHPAARRRPGSRKPAGAAARRALSPALAAGLVAVAIVPLALLGRSTVVRAMPQTAALFAGVGLPVNLRGVSLRDVAAFQTPAEGDTPAQLVVEGDLVGVARERVDVPELAVEVRDEHDRPLRRWTVPAPRAALETGETARFKGTLAAPPAQGRTVQIRFADAPSVEQDQPAGHPADQKAAPAKQGEASRETAAHGH